jgi:GH18 family chitinase
MAIAFVQGNSVNGSAGTTPQALPAYGTAVAVGDLIVLLAGGDGGQTGNATSVSDSLGNTYTRVPSFDINNTGATLNLDAFYSVVSHAGSSNVITLVFNSANENCVMVSQHFNGFVNTATLDKTQHSSNATSTTITSGATATLSTAVELVVGLGIHDSTVSAISLGSGYTNLTTVSIAARQAAMESKVVAATTAVTATFTIAATRINIGGVLTFQDLANNTKTISVSDNVTITDIVPDIIRGGIRNPSVFDSITVSESVTMKIPSLQVSVFDSVTITEALVYDPDKVYVTEFVSISIVSGGPPSPLSVSVFDSVKVVDWFIKNMADLFVMAYLPVYRVGSPPIADLPWSQLSAISYFAIAPNSDGSLNTNIGGIGNVLTDIDNLVTAGHGAGKKVLITVGGSGGATDATWESAINDTNRPTFISNLASFLTTHTLDGIDIDWEPFSTSGDSVNFIKFVKELRTAIGGTPLITFFLVSGDTFKWAMSATIQDHINYIGPSMYDFSFGNSTTVHDSPVFHVTGQPSNLSADEVVANFNGAGVKKSKLLMGVGFYTATWTHNSALFQSATPNDFTAQLYTDLAGVSGWSTPTGEQWDATAQANYLTGTPFTSYNGIRNIQAKIDYALANGIGGLLIFELGQAYLGSDTYSHYPLMAPFKVQNTPQVFVSDSITVSESVTINIVVPNAISVNDSITVSENVAIRINVTPSVSDNVTISENIKLSIPLSVNVFDSVTLDDTGAAGTVGYTSIGANTFQAGTANGVNNPVGLLVTMPASGSITKITANVFTSISGVPSGSGSIVARIYSGTAGARGSLLATTNASTVNGTAAWIDFTFASAFAASATNYWLQFDGLGGNGPGTAVANIKYDTGGATNTGYDLLDNGTPQYETNQYSMYATYGSTPAVTIRETCYINVFDSVTVSENVNVVVANYRLSVFDTVSTFDGVAYTSVAVAPSLGAPLSGNGRQVVQTAGGNIYVIVVNTGNVKVEVYKSTDQGVTFANQDSSHSPASQGNAFVAAVMDSAGLIHIAYTQSLNSTEHVTYNPSTDLFGTPETAFTGVLANTPNAMDIAVDSNDVPHIVTARATNASNQWAYANKVGGTWNTPVLTTILNGVGSLSILIDNNNLPQIAVQENITAIAAYIGNANNTTSFTRQSLATSFTPGSVSIAMDSSHNTWVSYIDASGTTKGNLIEHLSGDAWSTWQTAVAGPDNAAQVTIAAIGSTIHLLYENTLTLTAPSHIVSYSPYINATYVPTIGVAAARAQIPKLKWANLNDNGQAGNLNYTFSDNSTVLFGSINPTSAVTLTLGSASSLTLSVFDSVTVSESVTPKVTVAISVSDSITVSENINLVDVAMPFVFDSVTTSENVQVNVNTFLSVFDSVTVSENIKLSIPLPVSVFDSVTTSENVNLVIPVLFVSAVDNVTVSEFLVDAEQSTFSVTDSITVSENINLYIPILFVSVFDSVTITDVPKQAVLVTPSVFDSITVSESVNISVVFNVSVFDSVTVSEAVTLTEVSYISVSDNVTLSENVTLTIPVLFISVFDQVNLSEFFNSGGNEAFSIFDNVTVSEAITMFVAVPLSVSDNVTVSENVTNSVQVTPSVFDSVTVSENVSLTITTLFLSVFDSVTVSELFIAGNAVVVFDSVTVSESVSFFFPKLVLSVFDSVTVSENFNSSIVTKLSVFDSVTVSENVSEFITSYFLSVSDQVTVSENIVVQFPVIFLSVFDSVTVSEFYVAGASVVTFDSVTVSESITIKLVNLVVSTFDSVTVSDSFSFTIPVFVSVHDNVTVSEFISAGTIYNLFLTENVTISENFASTIIKWNYDPFEFRPRGDIVAPNLEGWMDTVNYGGSAF